MTDPNTPTPAPSPTLPSGGWRLSQEQVARAVDRLRAAGMPEERIDQARAGIVTPKAPKPTTEHPTQRRSMFTAAEASRLAHRLIENGMDPDKVKAGLSASGFEAKWEKSTDTRTEDEQRYDRMFGVAPHPASYRMNINWNHHPGIAEELAPVLGKHVLDEAGTINALGDALRDGLLQMGLPSEIGSVRSWRA